MTSIRRATVRDAELLARHRAAVWHEVGDWSADDLAPQVPVWAEFFRNCIADGSYAGFIAERGDRVIGSGAVLVHLSIPRPGSLSDKAGRVQSVYVEQGERQNGVARAIMERILIFARESNLISLSLHPSEPARRLYTALGFEVADEMTLRFVDSPASAR
jgi:GNAT superfamily N-acetyltransferase